MPIVVDAELRRLSQKDFGAASFEVMRCAFELHRQIGWMFDEDVYRDAIACRIPGARKEVRIRISWDGFYKDYFLDLLVGQGAVFELKTAETLSRRHESQLINYLMLTELSHGKLINLRPERIQHRFVNTSLTSADRKQFTIDASTWQNIEPSHGALLSWLVEAVRDWGAGLERKLYEEAAVHFLGGIEKVSGQINIELDNQLLRTQQALLAGGNSILRVTALDLESVAMHEQQLRRFVNHTQATAVQWINVGLSKLTFKTIFRKR